MGIDMRDAHLNDNIRRVVEYELIRVGLAAGLRRQILPGAITYIKAATRLRPGAGQGASSWWTLPRPS